MLFPLLHIHQLYYKNHFIKQGCTFWQSIHTAQGRATNNAADTNTENIFTKQPVIIDLIADTKKINRRNWGRK